MKTFREYLAEGKVEKEVDLNEAKLRRNWNNRLSRIDELMSYLYEKDILNKTDKSKKDSLFNSYYRYYNDGDIPRKYANMTTYKGSIRKLTEEGEMALEQEVDDFITKTLSKYSGKYNKKDFLISKAELAKRYTSNGGSIDVYWTKRYAQTYNIKELGEMIDQLDELNNKIRSIIDEHFDNFSKIAELEDEISKK